jgi:CheY-like chemotaxis protein
LRSVVEAAVEASRPFIERGKHALRVTVEDPQACLDADPTRLAQVVGNLLTNAAKYTRPGGLIELRARREAGEAVLSVRDDGVGIEASRLGGVFEMFSQGEGALERTQGGLGIGLALVRSLVQMHGGSVVAASDGPGRGSEFTVRLPLADGSPDARPDARGASSVPPLSRRRVLVVDDNRDAADMLGIVLEQAGYEPTVFYDGPTALAGVGELAPEIAILDIGLPEMNGYAVARALRGRADLPEGLALVALTGWGSQGDKEKAADAGFDVHLTKPVDGASLRAALASIGRSRRARRE